MSCVVIWCDVVVRLRDCVVFDVAMRLRVVPIGVAAFRPVAFHDYLIVVFDSCGLALHGLALHCLALRVVVLRVCCVF